MHLDPDIRGLDLEAIAYKVCCDEGWPLERLDRVEQQYRAFLQCYRDESASGEVAPTREVDIFWHYHILDTQKYSEDCAQLFGRFLHHYPYSGVFSDADAAAQLKRVRLTASRIQQMLSTS